MFARGVFYFHSAPLPTCPEKSLSPIIPALARRARKSNHSRTYGIAGGGGCTGPFVRPIRRASKPFVSPTYQVSARNSLVSPTYAKTGGVPPPKNVGAPTFLIFPLIFHTFLSFTGLQHNQGEEEKSWHRRFGRGAKGALPDRVGTGARPALHWGIGNGKRRAGLKDQRYIEE
jgi:hypothetical protein